jgi:hypothetical protein
VFIHIFNNFEGQKNAFIKSGLLEHDHIQYHLRSNLCDLAKKMELVYILQQCRILPEKIPIMKDVDVRNREGKIQGIFYETCLYHSDDVLVDVLWKNKDINDKFESITLEQYKKENQDKVIPVSNDETSILQGSTIFTQFGHHPENNISRSNYRLAYACDKPDRNCGISVNNFGDFMKLIIVKN